VTLLALAPGKVNLCLFLGGVREDGRHELVTVFESVSLADELEVSVAGQDEVVCPGVDGPNLAEVALALLRARGWAGPALHVEIRKRIPVAGGMGGGSADAAALLRIAARLAELPDQLLQELAAELGADVPSQLAPGLALATGAGEQVQSRAPIAPHAFAIVPQARRLATVDVYREADRLGLPRAHGELAEKLDAVSAALSPGAELPASLLVNDLEPASLSLHPPIAGALDAARDAGADHALVCGSGPTVAGLFWGADADARATRAIERLRERFPGARAAGPVESGAGSPVFA